jgi:predicted ATPase/class 3 adenylate cyclase
MPVCHTCGEDNPDRARFCLACGSPLTAAVAPGRQERKRVSVLFCDLVGFTGRAEELDVEDVRGLLSPYYSRLRVELERFGGTVEKFIGDAVMALFGAPIAHEDDPERAVRAALAVKAAVAAMNDADPGLDLHVRIGVTTGEALVTLDASPERGEGMAAGDVVNTASRLQTAAPVDGVLADATTHRATERVIGYREAEPVHAKGKAAPVPAWQVTAPLAGLGVDVDRSPAGPLVGRERELDVLRSALDRARGDDTPQLVTVAGVPGIGKSRLIRELFQLVEDEPELIIWRQGRCLPYGDGGSLWALGEIVKAQAGIVETDAAGDAGVKLGRAVAALVPDEGEAAWVTRHLRPLAGLAGPAAAVPAEDGGRRSEAFAAWRRFIEALAEQSPAVLVFEDLHWADEALLDFVDHLIDWAADVPLLVVAATRPELLGSRPGWGGGKPNAVTVSLTPLSDADTTRLLGGLLDQRLLPAELDRELLAKTGGNPLYAEEYVCMLLDRGGRFWTKHGEGGLPLPETVEGIIAARLDDLDPGDKAVLHDAAVLGPVAWTGALAALGERDPAELEQRLHTLERRELLRRERRSQVAGERQYAFRHVLVRDVAYGQLPRPARAVRHRRAAEWLEGIDAGADRAELLATHYQAALRYGRAAGLDLGPDADGLAVRAVNALVAAGDRALELNALDTAVRWYRAALDDWPRGRPGRAQVLLRLGRAGYLTGATGPDLLEEASAALLADGDRDGAAEAEVMLATITRDRGRGSEVAAHAGRAVELLEGAGPSAARAAALNALANALIMAGESGPALTAGREALALAEQLGLDGERSRALIRIGCAMVDLGDSDGIEQLTEAVAIAEAANLPEAAYAEGNAANCLIQLGRLEEGFELQARAGATIARFGLDLSLPWLHTEQASEAYWRGRWDDALTGVNALLAGEGHYTDPANLFVRARISLARGAVQAAVGDMDAALTFARRSGETQFLLPLFALRARALLAAGRRAEAVALADDLLGRWDDTPPKPTNPDWFGDLATVLLELDRTGEFLDRAAGVERPTAWLEAATALAAGDFASAADRYAAIGSLPDEADARLLAAEALAAEGREDEAAAQLGPALDFHRRVGAAARLARGEALLAAPA